MTTADLPPQQSTLEAVREAMRELDGSRAARVALLAGLTRERLDEVGGVEYSVEGGAVGA